MIYISTGGVREQTGWETSSQLAGGGIHAVELSGGRHDPSQLAKLKQLKKTINFQIHNYFPPPEKPFVFNLASLNTEIAARSISHVEKSMQWALELDRPVYSFHGGFLLDPNVSELGSPIAGRSVNNRKIGLAKFLSNVNDLAEKARILGVELLIENNVLSERNYHEFASDPLLMTEADECVDVMQNTPQNVNLLVDVAHLKVSSESLGFDPVSFLQVCDPWIKAYHLSENDGKSDSNEPMNEDAWFWPYLKGELNYYSVEVYNTPVEALLQQKNLVRQMLRNSDADH